MFLKIPKFTISLAVTVSLLGIYSCSTTTTTTGTKTNVSENTGLPDRGIGNSKPDKRNKQGILKEAVSGKLNAPIIDPETGVTLSDYNYQIGSDDNNDGGENEYANGSIELTGLGKHKIKLTLENYPVMDNKEDIQTITDETTGNVRIYTADQDLQKYSISDGKTKLTIQTNPDSTWTVDGKPAKTPSDVAKLAMSSKLFSDASPHGVAAIYQLFKNQAKNGGIIENKKTLSIQRCDTGLVGVEPGDPTELLKEGLKALKEKNSKK